jgi:hypothetical protein
MHEGAMWRKKNSGGFMKAHDLIDMSPPCMQWVNLLLLHMYKDSIDTYPLYRSRGIPPVPHEDELNDGALSFDGIINCLKAMCSLDPVKYSIPNQGTFPINIGGRWYTVNVSFKDNSYDPLCVINLSPKDEAFALRGTP